MLGKMLTGDDGDGAQDGAQHDEFPTTTPPGLLVRVVHPFRVLERLRSRLPALN